jgi:hypothetical protein
MIAYTIEGAAAATPLGQALIRKAIEDGDLIAHYREGGSHPIILADDLRDWIASLPTERRTS